MTKASPAVTEALALLAKITLEEWDLHVDFDAVGTPVLPVPPRLLRALIDEIQQLTKPAGIVDSWRNEAETNRQGYNKERKRADALQAERDELQKQLRITSLAVPLEDELSNHIDEMLKYLAMQDGFTLAGIARLLSDAQRRMADDWRVIGSERLSRVVAEKERDALTARIEGLRDDIQQEVTIRLHNEQSDGPVSAGMWSAYEDVLKRLDALLTSSSAETGEQA